MITYCSTQMTAHFKENIFLPGFISLSCSASSCAQKPFSRNGSEEREKRIEKGLRSAQKVIKSDLKGKSYPGAIRQGDKYHLPYSHHMQGLL